MSALFAHTLCGIPASAVGAGVNVITILSASDVHIPGANVGVVVKVKVKLPDAISPAVGVYTAFNALALGVNVPAPPLQVADVATVMDPAKVTSGLLEQILCGGPASTVGAGLTVINTVSVSATQFK
jgi:hypothetical protein